MIYLEKPDEYTKAFTLHNYIQDNTDDIRYVLELGCGRGDNIPFVNKNVIKVIGIEIWKPYIDAKISNDYEILYGDATKYRDIIDKKYYDCAMMIDFLEHLTRESALDLISSLKEDFNKILLMIPTGEAVQTEDLTGFGAHEYQTHRSYWYEDDIKNMGFEYDHYTRFHSDTIGCIFGVWKKT